MITGDLGHGWQLPGSSANVSDEDVGVRIGHRSASSGELIAGSSPGA